MLFRLNVVSITVPPLRERREDIPVLAHHFLGFFEGTQGRAGLSFAQDSDERMLSHPWPGNLRELRNAIERAVIVGTASILAPHDLGLEGMVTPKVVQIGAAISLDEVERELRMRFLSTGVLLTLTTVAAAAWTLFVLSRLASSAAATVHETDELTATTAAISSAIEREDDALLVILGGANWGQALLGSARTVTDHALRKLAQDSGSEAQQRSAVEVRSLVREYRQAVDSIVQVTGGHLLERYYQEANPLLREAVAGVAKSRDIRFEEARAATAKARDEVTRERDVVLIIAALALTISAVVALRLARHVLMPLRELANAAAAIRDGNFETRVRVSSADEIGDVSEAFNEMTGRLAEFYRSNLGEILRAKRALEATMRALPDAVFLIDDQDRIAATNPHADQLFAELLGHMPMGFRATPSGAETRLWPASATWRRGHGQTGVNLGCCANRLKLVAG